MSRDSNKIFADSHQEKNDSIERSAGNLEWSVPIESVPLPSKGLLYGKESFFHKKELIDIKAMTAKEEDILLSSAYHKNNTVMKELIKSCIGVQGIDPDELILGDKNALAISIRITGYGSDYKTTVNCPACGAISDHVFDLSCIEIKRLGAEPVQEGVNAFEYVLPITKKRVIFSDVGI